MASVLRFSDALTSALSRQSWEDVLALAGRKADAETKLLHSRVVTFLWALAQQEPLQLRQAGTCTVLIAGAAHREEALAKSGAFSLLGDLLPDVNWQFFLVGPSLARGTDCIVDGKVRVQLLSGYLHNYAIRQQLKEMPPDCAVMFNSGVGCGSQEVTEPWRKSLPLVAQCLPVLFTSFSEPEAKREQAAMTAVVWEAGFGSKVLPNPFVVAGDHDGRAAASVSHNKVVWWLTGARPARPDTAQLQPEETSCSCPAARGGKLQLQPARKDKLPLLAEEAAFPPAPSHDITEAAVVVEA